MPNASDMTAVIDGDSKELLAALDRASTEMRNFETSTGATLKRIDDLFQGTFKNVGKAVDEAKDALAAAAPVMLFNFLHSEVQKGIDEFKAIGDAADAATVSTTFFQVMGYRANEANVAFSKVKDGLKEFAQELGKFKADEGDLKEHLEGSNAELLKQLSSATSAEQGLRMVANAIAALKSPYDQAKLAAEVFGKSNADLAKILNDGSDGLTRAAEAARHYGIIVDESVIRNSQDMRGGFEAVSKVLDTQFKQALLNIAPLLKEVGDGTVVLSNAVRRMYDSFQDIGTVTDTGLEERIQIQVKVLEGARDALKKAESSQKGTFDNNVISDWLFGTDTEANVQRLSQNVTEAIALMDKLLDERARRKATSRTAPLDIPKADDDSDDEADARKREAGLRQIAALNKMYYTETKQTLALIFAEEQEELRRFQKLLDEKAISNEQFETARQRMADVTAAKVKKLYEEEYQGLKRISETISKDLESAFSSWVNGSKFSAEELFKQILQDLIKLEFQLAVMQPLFGTKTSGITGQQGVVPSLLASVFHDGGTAGEGGASRMVSASVFQGAVRYHEGGVAGLLPREVPTILEEGETILKKGQSAGTTHVSMPITIDARGAYPESVEQIKAAIASLHAELPARAVAAVQDATQRGFIR
ncbi:phage tail tape measure C-terminal domain-containing protein [Rhodomicrobium lacus]|uniref:phage tail tape measure C-terminal domain-containing protein n=1 Tax=Rhodomicrobium lacus TaxID=2498452 RepID=UPI000F8D3023|nr:phage tail tape measure C-terminal domain-containing protein [Rhodomicrobium lacus]